MLIFVADVPDEEWAKLDTLGDSPGSNFNLNKKGEWKGVDHGETSTLNAESSLATADDENELFRSPSYFRQAEGKAGNPGPSTIKRISGPTRITAKGGG
jgi:hypothetical protein